MGKNKKKDKARNARKHSNGSSEIKRAEKRLAKALAEVDAARDKVARRQRELTTLMERHGPRDAVPADIESVVADAIPLDAPAHPVPPNGAGDSEATEVIADVPG